MLISCEKCSTTYVLDDKLIPAQGAPVQCTRCGHVFLARAPAPTGPTSTQMFGSPDPAPAPPPTNRTQMFGAPGSGTGPGAQAPTNRTVMFGVPGADAPPQSQGNAPASRTQMFGHHEAPTGPGTSPAPNRTVMFGAPGSEAPASGAAPPSSAPASRTVMFGAPGSDAPAPAGGTNRTMMFGVAGSDAPAPPPPAAAGPGAANRTMMFGAPGSEASPHAAPPANAPTNRTMMFGAPGSDAAAPPAAVPPGASPNKTMMFGVTGDAPPPPQGPVPQSPGANPRSTMMFGAVPPNNLGQPTQPPPPRTSNTMMFGTPAAQQPGQGGSPPPQQKTSSTMMFGTPVGQQVPPPAVSPPSQKSSSTMIFGATPVQAPGPGKAPKLTEATVRIGPEDLERMMREHEALNRNDGSGGITPPESSPAAAAPNKTQMFAMTQPDGATPPAGNDAVSRQNKTQMFAMSDAPEGAPAPASGVAGRKTRPSSALPDPHGALPPPPGVDTSILDTFPPDGQGQRKRATPMPAPATDPSLGATAGPGVDSASATVIDDGGGARVDLPPETPDLLQAGANGSTQPVAPVEGDPAAVLRASVARRNRIALILIALVLVAAAVGVTWKVFGKMLLNRAPPAAAVEQCEKALSQLRFDDSKSKEAAVAQLTDLVAKFPDYVEGHAALVTSVTLQLDDVQQRVRRIEQLVERKNTLIARYNKEKTPANWETTAQALVAQVDELIKEHRPLSEEGHTLDSKAREAYKGLESAVNRVGDPSKQAKLAALRAQALFHGVSGTDQALVLSKRYETTADGSAPDGWIDLAIPEYAANARVSEELMTQALTKLDELHKRDSTFLRTYVLSARLHLIKKELEAATTDLDQVLSMRKEHDVAGELREWVRKLPKADDKKDPAP